MLKKEGIQKKKTFKKKITDILAFEVPDVYKVPSEAKGFLFLE